jgi:hypothetical protein
MAWPGEAGPGVGGNTQFKIITAIIAVFLFFPLITLAQRHGHDSRLDRRTSEADRAHYDHVSRRFDSDYFHDHFGPSHPFHPERVFMGGLPRFWYGGFWFGITTVWPTNWDCANAAFIDVDAYGDYFLACPTYTDLPRIFITVAL